MSSLIMSEENNIEQNIQNISQCNLFYITESACAKIHKILLEDAKRLMAEHGGDSSKDLFLRFTVMPGGCKGMQYDFSLDNQKEKEDLLIEDNGSILLAIDNISLPFVEGSTLDYYESVGASAFKVINPNTGGGCGCGKSFAPKD